MWLLIHVGLKLIHIGKIWNQSIEWLVMKPISVEYSNKRLIDATEDNLDISVQIYYGLHTGQNQLCVKRHSRHLRYLCVMNRYIITDGF